MNDKDKIIKDAQYRKGLSIAFFNATNAAIELVKNMEPMGEEQRKERITEIRDWLLEEHKTYYAQVIARVGGPYDAKESIKKLKAAKNLEELKQTWLLFSEDERRDEDIRKVAQEVKKKLS